MRRRTVLGYLTVASALLTSDAFSQLAKTVYSEEPRIRAALKQAKTNEEILALAGEWNEVYRVHAQSKDPEYARDWDLFIDKVNGAIRDKIGEGVIGALLAKHAPRLLAAITKLAVYLEPLGPIFVFIEAMTPSQIASDAMVIHLANKQMQEEIRAALDRVNGGPQWYFDIRDSIVMPDTGPTIQLQ